MPFPVAGEPLHSAAEAPMTGATRHDHAVELVLAHPGAQGVVPAHVFLLGELIVYRVPIIGRIVHVREWAILIESCTHLVPALM